MAFILHEDPMPAIGGYVSFNVDTNNWAVPGQTVLVVDPSSSNIGYFTIAYIYSTPALYVVCINDPLYTSYNVPPVTPILQNSYIGPASPPVGPPGMRVL